MELLFNQEWVTRIATGKLAEIEPDVAGAGSSSMFSQEILNALFEKFAISRPARDIYSRGWIVNLNKQIQERALGFYEKFIELNLPIQSALFRATQTVEVNTAEQEIAVMFWVARVQEIALKKMPNQKFDSNALSPDFIQRLVKLSRKAHGPKEAIDILREIGIVVVFEDKLSEMNVDGSAFINLNSNPTIGLTLRHDRVDNFWFTLMHEIGHIKCHLLKENGLFIDALEEGYESDDEREAEADIFALDSLIPREVWRRSSVSRQPDQSNIESLAKELHIHPGIVAGRIRHDLRKYTVFHEFLGSGQIRVMITN